MMCQQPGCTRKGDLACTIGETRKVLCIEHQAKYRLSMTCGGRTVTVHHGVDLDEWSRPAPRRAALASETPTYAIATVAETVAVDQLAIVAPDPDPFPPPNPPTTLRVIMPPTRPLCLWSDCEREAKQGPCCLIHNDRLRKIYGTAAKLTTAQIMAAPEAWELRIATQYAAKRAALVRPEPAVVVPVAPVVVPVAKVVVPVAKVVVPIVKDESPTVKDAPNVDLAIVLIENAMKYTRKDARLDALLTAAMMVLR
jgi:hypothetical protein